MNKKDLIKKYEEKLKFFKELKELYVSSNSLMYACASGEYDLISSVIEDIKSLPNEPKTVSNDEQKMKSCVTCRYGSLPCCNHCIGCIDHSKHTT